MQVPPELVNDALTYMNIVGSTIFLQALFSTLAVIFHCNGYMRYTMYVALVFNVTNIVGNSLFLYGWFGLPNMGVAGVATSSVVSRVIGVVILLVLFKRKINGHISPKYLRPFPWATLKRLLHIGLPAGGESLSYTMAQTVLLGMANTMGATTVSTRAYSMLIAWHAIVYSAAVSQGTQIIVGHLVGAGDEDSADKRVRKTLLPALLIALCVTLVLYFSSDLLFSVFTKNPEIIALGKKILMVEIFLELGRTTNLVIIRSLQAAGDVRFPIFIGIISMWGVSVVAGYLLGKQLGWGLMGIWIGMACDECLRAVIVLIRWFSGVWRGRSFIHRKPAEDKA
jgi:putative MATE family efflux protein